MTTLETTSGVVTMNPWVDPTTLSTCRTLTAPCAMIPYEWVGLALKPCYLLLLPYSPLFVCVGALVDDGACPFCFSLKYDWLALLFYCTESFPGVIDLLFWNSFVSLIYSSSTYCTWIMGIVMSISPSNIFPCLPCLTGETTKQGINLSFFSCKQPCMKHIKKFGWTSYCIN